VAFLQGLIVLVIAMILGFRPSSISMIPLAFLYMILIAFLFTALGTAIASKLEDMQAFQLIMNFMVMPIFFLSGALFPLNNLPTILGIITKINPLSYGVDGIRGALTGAVHLGFMTDFFVLSGLIVIVGAIGSYLFSKIEV
jgi:ABC-2 type transport system permease protein